MALCRHGNPEGAWPVCDEEWNEGERQRLEFESLEEMKKQTELFRELKENLSKKD